jgi:hypothetical protein
MPTINAYIPQPTPLLFETELGLRAASGYIEFGGWDHVRKTLTPIRISALPSMPGAATLDWVLDSLAAAAEAGRLDVERYSKQLFASTADVRDFRQILRDAGIEKWVNDRHRAALGKIGCAECDCATYPAVSGFFDRHEVVHQ